MRLRGTKRRMLDMQEAGGAGVNMGVANFRPGMHFVGRKQLGIPEEPSEMLREYTLW